MKTEKKEFSPEEKLIHVNRGFVKGRQLKTAGQKDFEKKIKYAPAPTQNGKK